jgi:hypothetical protein
MGSVLEELAPPAHPAWAADQQGVARRKVDIGGVAFVFEVHAAREHTVLALDEAIILRPDAEVVSELSDWRAFGLHGQRRVIEPLGLTVTVRTKVDEEITLAVDAVLDLAQALLAQRVDTALAGYRKLRGGWETNSLCRKVGSVPRPHRYHDRFAIAEAVVRRGRAEEIIRAASS